MHKKLLKLFICLLGITQYSMFSMSPDTASTLALRSPSFPYMGPIPDKYAGLDGISPALEWQGIPTGTRTFALIFDDPEIPLGVKDYSGKPIVTWDHWIVFNIPGMVTGFSENIKDLPAGTQLGIGSLGKTTYLGPCPPDGLHHYYFKLYALDTVLPLEDGATKVEVEYAMRDHILDQTKLVGTYTPKK